MESFRDMIGRENDRRATESQAKLQAQRAKEEKKAVEIEQAWPIVLQLARETALYLEELQVPTIGLFEKAAEDGRSVYRHIADGWFLYMEGWFDEGFYEISERVGLTTDGTFVNLSDENRYSSTRPAPGQKMSVDDKVITSTADPRRMKYLYEQNHIPRAVADCAKGKGPLYHSIY